MNITEKPIFDMLKVYLHLRFTVASNIDGHKNNLNVISPTYLLFSFVITTVRWKNQYFPL